MHGKQNTVFEYYLVEINIIIFYQRNQSINMPSSWPFSHGQKSDHKQALDSVACILVNRDWINL